MREILYKNLVANDSRKKDISVREVFEKDGRLAKTERRSFYYIKDVSSMHSIDAIQSWLDKKNAGGVVGNRRFHITRVHNEGLAEDKFIFKVLGTFYAIINSTIYTIGFMHSFKVGFTKTVLPH